MSLAKVDEGKSSMVLRLTFKRIEYVYRTQPITQRDWGSALMLSIFLYVVPIARLFLGPRGKWIQFLQSTFRFLSSLALTNHGPKLKKIIESFGMSIRLASV